MNSPPWNLIQTKIQIITKFQIVEFRINQVFNCNECQYYFKALEHGTVQRFRNRLYPI